MDNTTHSLAELFEQLGLPSEKSEIDTFIRDHRLDADTSLHEAPFWQKAQAAFLREALMCDSDWAIQADLLNVMLHEKT